MTDREIAVIASSESGLAARYYERALTIHHALADRVSVDDVPESMTVGSWYRWVAEALDAAGPAEWPAWQVIGAVLDGAGFETLPDVKDERERTRLWAANLAACKMTPGMRNQHGQHIPRSAMQASAAVRQGACALRWLASVRLRLTPVLVGS